MNKKDITKILEALDSQGEGSLKNKLLSIIRHEQVIYSQNILESALQEIARDFEENNIEYVVIGGVAVRKYNIPRNTEDIDILVSKKSFKKISDLFIGKGYLFRIGSKKNMNYIMGTGRRVQLDILVEGDKENGIVLPKPSPKISMKLDGIWFLSLTSLIVFKLNAGRTVDHDDVVRLLDKNSHLVNKSFINKIKKQLGEKKKKTLDSILANKS